MGRGWSPLYSGKVSWGQQGPGTPGEQQTGDTVRCARLSQGRWGQGRSESRPRVSGPQRLQTIDPQGLVPSGFTSVTQRPPSAWPHTSCRESSVSRAQQARPPTSLCPQRSGTSLEILCLCLFVFKVHRTIGDAINEASTRQRGGPLDSESFPDPRTLSLPRRATPLCSCGPKVHTAHS